MRTFFGHSLIVKTCIDFFNKTFYVLQYFTFYNGLLLNPFLITSLTLSHTLLYAFFNKKRHGISFIETLCISVDCLKHYTQWLNFIVTLVTNKVFESFFTKGNLVRYHYSINIYIVQDKFDV